MGLHQPQVMQTIQAATTFPIYQQYDSWKQGESSGSLSGLQQDLTMATSGYNSYTAMLSGGSGGETQDSNWAAFRELMEPAFNNATFLDMEGNCNANEIAHLGTQGFNAEDNQNLNELGLTPNFFMPTPRNANEIVHLGTQEINPEDNQNLNELGPTPLLPVIASQRTPALNIQPDESGLSTGSTFQTERSCVTGDETESSVQLGSRNRKRTGPREVIPLTTGSVALPAWLESSLAYLSKDIEEKVWAECLEIWVDFEKDGLSDVASVSPKNVNKFT
jgi:hypothetical protein